MARQMDNQARIAEITRRLQTLDPTEIKIIDESHLHAGHDGARSGAGHFALQITATVFSDKSLIERHRMVYAAVGDMMHSEIHALSIDAKTPKK